MAWDWWDSVAWCWPFFLCRVELGGSCLKGLERVVCGGWGGQGLVTGRTYIITPSIPTSSLPEQFKGTLGHFIVDPLEDRKPDVPWPPQVHELKGFGHTYSENQEEPPVQTLYILDSHTSSGTSEDQDSHSEWSVKGQGEVLVFQMLSHVNEDEGVQSSEWTVQVHLRLFRMHHKLQHSPMGI